MLWIDRLSRIIFNKQNFHVMLQISITVLFRKKQGRKILLTSFETIYVSDIHVKIAYSWLLTKFQEVEKLWIFYKRPIYAWIRSNFFASVCRNLSFLYRKCMLWKKYIWLSNLSKSISEHSFSKYHFSIVHIKETWYSALSDYIFSLMKVSTHDLRILIGPLHYSKLVFVHV